MLHWIEYTITLDDGTAVAQALELTGATLPTFLRRDPAIKTRPVFVKGKVESIGTSTVQIKSKEHSDETLEQEGSDITADGRFSIATGDRGLSSIQAQRTAGTDTGIKVYLSCGYPIDG